MEPTPHHTIRSQLNGLSAGPRTDRRRRCLRPLTGAALAGFCAAALLLPSTTLAAAPAGPRQAAPQTSLAATGVLPASLPEASLTSHITDDAGLLSSTSSDAVASLAERGVNLWVVTYSDASEEATDFAERAWQATGLSTSDLLLVINVADDARSYAFDGSASGSVWSSSKRDDVRAKVKERLSAGDWDGAVTTVADAGASGDSSSESSSSENAIALGLGGLILASGAGYLVFRRKTRSGARAGGGGPVAGADTPLPELASQAGTALVEADDAVRTADEELAFAEAEFGAGGAEDLSQAVQVARKDLEHAFAQRKLLDDDIPDTPAQQRQMYQQILAATAHARQVLEAPLADLTTRRQAETNLPAEHARTDELITTAREQVASARQVLPTLQQVFAAQRVARLEPLPDQAEALLHAAETALTQSRQAYNMGGRAAALEQLRLAQHALAQVRSLTDQIMHARERWQAEDREAAERAAEQQASATQAATRLPTRLARLAGQVAEVDGYLATHRGAIGPGTRTALSEAWRLHQEASTQAAADPAGAMEKVLQAEQLVAQAQTSAEAEVRRYRGELPPARTTGSGLDLGSLLLGGLLFGNPGGHHHDHWDDHHWGGGPGGFGGGGFGGGGGGFGGGGGRF